MSALAARRQCAGAWTRLNASWLAIPAIVLLGVFFVWPVVQLLVLSVRNDAGELSPANFEKIFTQTLYVQVLTVTLRISLLTALISILFGYPLAYWLSRMSSGKRGVVLLFVMVPFWTSYLVKTFSWMIILGRTGVLNQILGGIGVEPLSLLQGEGAVLVGMVHSMLPLAVLTMLPVVLSVDRRLPAAAQTLGAHPVRAFWHTYVPLSLPGIASAGLLVFMTSLGFFIVPALLGGPKETFIAQTIISQIQQLLNYGFASALSMLLLATTFIAWLVYDRLFGMSTLSGNQPLSRKRNATLRAVGKAVLNACAAVCVRLADSASLVLPRAITRRSMTIYGFAVMLFLVAPILFVVPIAFTSSQFLDFPPSAYGVQWFEAYFGSPLWIGATVNSFVIGFLTAICATSIGGLAAFALARSQTRWKTAIFALLLAPMIIPRIVLAVGLMYLFARMNLMGTRLGLVIGHTVLALPFTFVTTAAVLKNYDWRLDQAAATLGANPFRILTRITVPLIGGGLVAAFLFAFITSFDELTLALFTSGGIVTTLPKQMWDDMFLQLTPTLAAASVVVFAVVLVLLLMARKAAPSRY